MIHVVSASVVGLLASLFVTQSAGHSAEPLSSRSRGFLLALLRLALASVLVAAILVTGSALGAYPLAPAWQGGRWLDLLVAGLAALALLAEDERAPRVAARFFSQ